MAANFLAPFSVLVFAVLLGQKSYYMPHSMMGIDGFGLNITLASSDPILTGFVAIHSQNRLNITSCTCSSSAVIKRFLLSVLLLGGDIQLNPGPNWKYPCGVCNKAVRRNQKGIQCDHCDLWYHTKCCSIGDKMYQILANSSCTWMCVDCGLPSFSDSLFETSLDSFNSFSSLEILSQELSQQSSFTTPSNDKSKEKKRSNKNTLTKLKVLSLNLTASEVSIKVAFLKP